MADTNIPDKTTNSTISKQEVTRTQQAAQKAELEKSVSDYDTGDSLAARQDILNPNLHYGLLNETELELPQTVSGPAESGVSSLQSGSFNGGQSNDLASPSSPVAPSPLSQPSLSASDEIIADDTQSGPRSIDHSGDAQLQSTAALDTARTVSAPIETFAAPTQSSNTGAPTPTSVGTADKPNNPVEAIDQSQTTSENVSLDGMVTASDLDGDAISYSLDGQPAEGTVTLNADGSYSFAPGTDFDDLAVGESRTVSFDFTADDGKGSTDTGTITIEVTGTNDAPTAIDLTANSINENDGGAVIGTLSTTDIDTSDTHTYSVSDDRFEAVDDGTGTMVLKLKDGQSLDHENEPSVTLTVTADDGHGGTFDQDITINVTDLNEAVTANDGAETTSENVSLDGMVTASDLDGDAISYSLDGQPAEGTVTLNADGSYSFAPGTDFDDLAVGESRTVSFDFTADDGKGSTDTGTVTIEVTGTNDAPTAIDLTANSINENDGGAVIGTLSTTDIDTSDTHTYTVSDDRFEAVDDGTGTMVLKLKDGQSLDHESEPTVTLTVTADDGHGGTFDQDITINVADVNEAVTANDGAETTSENVSLDGTVTASDLDGDAISYSLDGQPAQGTVTLNADGSYSFAPGTDFDDLAVGESRTVSFDFTADDGKGSTDTGTVTIEVTGTNDAPTAIDLTANSINENDGGAVIGTLSTTDIDTSDTHTYTVSDDRFEAVDDGTGTMVLKLKDGQSLDHESEPTVTLTVTADDGHGGTFDQDITINVADVNEAVTANDGAETTSENVSLDGMVTASDLDGDAISYSLDGQPAQGTVTLNADGSYSFAPGTDFDDLAVGESRTVSFDFTADDGKGSTDTGTVTIEVTGTNDAPTAIDLTANSINENDSGAVIGTLSTTDIDTSDTHTYTVSDDRFEAVDDGTGTMVLKLKDGQSLDHESEPTVTLTVTADDGHGGTFDQDITINVADVNEAVTANDGAETTSENVSLDGTVTASDLDGDAISYSLDGQPTEGTVTLNADGSYSFAPGTDFDDLAVGESRTVSFDFTADDGKGSTDTGTVTIEVTGTNDAPTAIDLTANSINENDGGAVIGTLSTTDIDTSDTHTYTVSDDRFEAVDDGTGTMVLKLKDGQSLDHESEPTVTLTVTADDGHGGTFDQDITINVADVNEAVTANDGAETTSENVSLDGMVTASDLDGDAISYSLDGQPTEGTVTLNADGSYSFAPGTDFDDLAVGESRTVSFDFTADDGKGSTDTGTVTIEVTGTNDAPTAIDLTANSINENDGGAVIGTLSTTDIDTSDTHTYTVSDDRFEAVDDGTGTMVLKLKDGQSLDHESEPTVTLTVTADDGHGGTFDQDITINVADVNEAVTANDGAETTSENVSLDGMVTASDLDGDAISYSLDGQPTEGTVTLNADGSYSFAPGTDFDDLAVGESRTVSFDFTADDGKGSTDTGTVTIEVTGTNDAPTAIDLTANSINENDGGAVIGTLSTTDIDTSDTHTYTVSDDRFEAVDDGTGTMVLKLKDGQSLDHESEPTVTLTVTADDGHGGTFDQDITINVADVNEAVTANDGAETTSENVSLDGTVTASDLDGDAISYSLDGQPAQGTVTLNADGSYSFAPGTDFDDLAVGESRTVSFDFTADDGKGSTDTGTVTIEVTGTNDAPTAIDLTANSINENDSGAVIGTLSTTDIDTSDTHTYTVSDDRFEAVDDGTGTMVLKLKDGQSLDHESEPTVTLTVTADDGHGGTFDQDITINVADVNEAVTANDGAETTSENVSLDGTVTASDLDGDAISYSLDGQPTEGTVTLNADGSYSFAPGTDFDDLAVGESRTVSFDFTADDGKGSTDTGTVTIEVTGTNDAPTAIDLTANSINENDGGAVIGTLSTTDIDTSDTHTYTVSDDRFEAVDDGTGTMVLKLKDGQSLDHESEPTVTLTVTADDGHGGTFDQDITINVADVNEAVTANDGAETTSENVSLDGMVTASDLDGDAISYSLDGQPTEGTVTLNADGSYSFAPGTDFDDLAVGESRTVSFDFTADDGKGSTDTGTVTIEVTGTNDAPTAIDLTANSINENDGGAVIGTLSTTDIDTSDTHTYTVSDDRFEAVDDGTGTMVLKLKDGQSLDHESEPTVTLTVTADDGHGGTFDQDITINVADVNEAVTANDGAETTSENVSLDGMVTASDLDGDAISYSLDGQPAQGTVTLNADGSYSFAPGTDFDDLAVGESRTVSFDFTADDGKGSTDTGTVTIEVTGTNDAPTAIDLTANSINENDGGAVIGTLSTTDIDTSDTHTYTVSDDRFEAVDDGTGTMVLKLKDGQSLDHESEPTVTLTVTADDGHGGTFDQDITINVADVNEAVTANDGAETTSENVSLDGTVTASDLDGDAISYSLDGQPTEGTVTLNADGSYSFAPGTDFDDLAVGESRTVSFDFTADDGKGSTDTGTVTIEVTGTNDAPTAIDLTANSINENDGGAVIGTLSTTDIDTSDTHTYSVSDDRFEAVDDGTGTMVLKLKDGQSLDHESEPTVTLTVTADDGHGGTFDQDITINVADVNEAVTANDGAETTSENVSLDGTVTASDLDGDAISYSLDGQPTEGTVTLNADGSYSFAPGTDFDDLAVGESRTVSFDFTADDGKGSTDTGTVTIEVTGTNDAPTAIDLTANSINENDGGAVIGTLSTTDIDTSDTHTYTVSDDRFEAVDDGTGTMVLKLKDGQSLDHESEPTVTLTVTADDGHGGTFDQDFTINVTDVNEAPTLTAEGSYNFLYNGSFEVFNGGTHGGGDGTGWFEGAYIDGWTQTNIDIHEAGHNGLGATDGDYHVDLAGQTNGSLSRDMQGMEDGDTYSLSMDLKSRGTDGTGTGDATAAAGQSVVEIVWNGEVIATVDPSTDGLGWHTYTFDIVGGSGDGSNVITFNEVGSDNSFGTILDNFQITDSNGFGVLENQAGAQIATLGVIDEDVGDSHSYSASDSRFEVVDDGNGTMVLKLKDGVSLDHESEPTVDVTVTVTDSAGNTDSQVLNVTVGDINEAPLSIELSNNAVIEDNAGQIIGFLSTTDEDIGDSHSYTVSDDRFEVVDDGTGSMVLKLKDGQSIDADTEPTVNLSITSTDSGGMSTQQSFAINVDPVADAPSLSIGNAQTTIIDTNFESFAGDSTSFLPEAEGWQTDSSVEVWQGDTGNYGAASTHIELNTDPRDGYADAPNIYQTVDTVDGATYTLTLDYAGRPGYGADVNTIEVIWDGQVVATISDDASDSSVYNWQTHTINLTGDGDPSKIEIREAGVDVDYGRGMHVDNISMVESITSAAHGEAGEAINLPDIMPTLPDADGSESLALSLGNLPDGTVLSDDTNSVTIGADGESGDIASWDLDNLQATPPADYVGTVNVQVTATTTETSNGDTATTTTSFNMQVEEPHVVNEVTGTTASETLDGTSGDDLISASAGDDTINAYDGSDIVYGGDGNDTIDGGSGNDALYGDNGNDVIVGGGGSDTIYGGGGNDSMSGGDGNDNFFYLLGDGNDTINGGSGSDWTDSIEILAADGTETTEYGTDWTINLTSGTSGMTPDGEQMLLSDDATGTIDFDDGSSITFENIDRIAW